MSDPKPDRPHLLTVAKLSPLLMAQLEAAFTVHDRLHESDPAAFDAVAPRIRAVAASGDSRVPAYQPGREDEDPLDHRDRAGKIGRAQV
mgnify:CR=1 FL=1